MYGTGGKTAGATSAGWRAFHDRTRHCHQKTMLEGFYDFKLDLRPYLLDRQPGDPPIDLPGIAMSALDAQLGLKLEARKIPMEVLTVDHAERTPTEN